MPLSKEELLTRLATALPLMIESASKRAIRDRAKGLFEHANWAEEQAHQLRNYSWLGWGTFPGMQSALLDELERYYGNKS